MKAITVRNATEALITAMHHMSMEGVRIGSRVGDVLELPEPLCTTYTRPTERVMMIEQRDANPFFHLMESLWILAGRKDVEWLAQFNGKMRDYSDDGEVFHAPYGHRLRRYFRDRRGHRLDQIKEVIKILKSNPEDRRAVLQIWDAERDLARNSVDIPCNDLIFLKIRNGKLNMTVCNRSNDLIWGAYGANVVQFSMIQEYIAGMVGVEVGVYNQISDSAHVYLDNPKTAIFLDKADERIFTYTDAYKYGEVSAYPIMNSPEHWDEDLDKFMSDPEGDAVYVNHFFHQVAVPAYCSWMEYKRGNYEDAMFLAHSVAATDWNRMMVAWMTKRIHIKEEAAKDDN